MTLAMKFRTRSPVKQDSVIAVLRGKIVEGIFAPGEQLPTRAEMEQTFQVSSVTLQRALDRLMSDGFIYASGSRGTFVSENPPHLTRYGLVIPYRDYEVKSPNRFFASLVREAGRLDRPGHRLPVLVDEADKLNGPDYQHLLQEVRNQCFAGLIFAHPVNFLAGSPLLEDASIPRVEISSVNHHPEIPVVVVDHQSFLNRALDYLVSRGRRRIGVIGSGAWLSVTKYVDGFRAGLAARQLETRPYWVQAADLNFPQSAKALAELMMLHPDPAMRPDGVLITDDNLLEHASMGLMAAGVRVPEDLDVVSHCNFPHPPPTALAIRRLGFDVRMILKRSIELIDMMRRDEPVPSTSNIPAFFEDEISPVQNA